MPPSKEISTTLTGSKYQSHLVPNLEMLSDFLMGNSQRNKDKNSLKFFGLFDQIK